MSVDSLVTVHENIAAIVGAGAVASILGLTSHFLSHEHRDVTRLDLDSSESLVQTFQGRKRGSQIILILSALLYIAGLAAVTVGVCMYRTEREEIADTIPGMIQQIRTSAAQPDLNEVAILTAFSSALVLAGLSYSLYIFSKQATFGTIGPAVYVAGWLMLAFAGSMNNRSVSSIKNARLAWTLPGATAIVAGTLLFPWQLQNSYVSGPAWPIATLGYMAFTIGTSFLTPAPA